MKTKVWFGEQVLNELQDGFRNRDEKIDIREVYLRMDALVNERARQGYFDNWKLNLQGLDEQFITTFDTVTVIDLTDGQLSYLTIPASYVDLPNNGGIIEIAPKKYYLQGHNNSVIIITREQWRAYNNTMAASMQNRLFGYLEGSKFVFGKSGVKKQYGDMSIRLAIRDSSMISDTDIYPIPADKEQDIITELVMWFRNRRLQPTDVIRDGLDKA